MSNIAKAGCQFVFLIPLILLSGCQAATINSPLAIEIAAPEARTPAVPSPVVSFMAVSQSQQLVSGAVVTFAQPFVPGDVSAKNTLQAITFDGQKLATQVDWKATNKDGSRRHGIITVVLPDMQPQGRILIGLYKAPVQPLSGASRASETPPRNIRARVVLKIHGESYEAAFQKLAQQGMDRRWLTGSLATEWHVSGPVVNKSGQPSDRIWLQFYVRHYPISNKTRVEVIVENTWAFKSDPHSVTYDAQIFVDGKNVYSIQNLTHTDHARWRKVFWVGGTPKVYVRHDLGYLKATGAVPNYDPRIRVPASVVVNLYKRYVASDRNPMEVSIVMKAMGTTGGRADIGPLPSWTVLRLLTMDPRLMKVVRGIDSLAGSWPIHLRDEKTGRPVSLVNRPLLTIHPNMLDWPKNPLPHADYGEWPDNTNLRPDVSHEPSLAFIPYLLTGDYYYLEELQFWAAWNPLRTAPSYRGHGKGLMAWTQVRGQAWALRTLGQVAYITPDDNPMKTYWIQQLQNNLKWYNAHYTNNPNANKLGALHGLMPYNHHRALAPWQDDYFTWMMSYLVDLGFDNARPMLEYKSQFPVGRMTAPGYCWVFASAYYLNVRESAHSRFYETFARVYAENVNRYADGSVDITKLPCGSEAMARQLGKRYKAGDMSGYPWSPEGYPSYMQPALAAAVDAGYPGAMEAWRIFANRTTKPDYSSHPTYAIVPRKLFPPRR